MHSGVAFHRRVGDRLLDFGTSGMLYADNLVMYDRQTESLWPQLPGQASVGALTGTRLTAVPIGVLGWRQFRASHLKALVLTRETGHDRPYGENPYIGYDDPEGGLLVEPPDGRDPRLAVKERVIGIELDLESVAIPRAIVDRRDVLTLTLAGRQLVIWRRAGQPCALDDPTIAGGREIVTVGVFDPPVSNRTLSFTATGDGFRDAQTGSTWNVLGEAIDGRLKGRRLRPVTHLETFWFAWVAFQPDTTVYD